MRPIDQPGLTRFVASLVGSQDAEDVVQDALVKILRRHGTFRDESRWETWVFAVAKHTALSWLRKRARAAETFVPLDPSMEGVTAPDTLETLGDPRLRLIPADVRALIVAWDTYGTRHEAAAALGITLSQFKERLSRARRAVRP